jgi:hypothetical protein
MLNQPGPEENELTPALFVGGVLCIDDVSERSVVSSFIV